MVDFAYVCGMPEDDEYPAYGDIDAPHDPEGHLGGQGFGWGAGGGSDASGYSRSIRSRRYSPPKEKPSKTCRYCGASNLRFHLHSGGGWRLFHEDGTLHECMSYVSSHSKPDVGEGFGVVQDPDAELVQALMECARTFENYERHHRMKGDTVKADDNGVMVKMIYRVLTKSNSYDG